MVGMQASPSGIEGFRRRLEAIERQIHEMRGGARIGEIFRGRTIQFQDPDGSVNLLIGDGATSFYNADGTTNAALGGGSATFYDENALTGSLGGFTGQYWDVDAEAWVATVVRGLALYRPGDPYPFFSVGYAESANRSDITAGYGSGGALESIDLQAEHFAVRTSAGGARISLNPAGSGNVIVEADDDSTNVYLGNSNSGVTISPNASSEFRVFNLGTHATPANLSVSSNVVRVVSSALKYKAEIEPLHVDREELLSVSAISYVDRQAKQNYERQLVEGVDEPWFGSESEREEWVAAGSVLPELKPPPRYPGFIADEWAEHETLRQFVRFEDGEVEGFHYDRVTVAHHEVIKDHEARIAKLESENAQMKAELAELKATVKLKGLKR